MLLQDLSVDFLDNLLERLDFEIGLRYMVHDDSAERNPYYQPMYLIPMWNICEKIKSFKPYFDELDMIFPTLNVYRHPIDLFKMFPADIIKTKEEDFTYKGQPIKVTYKYI